MRHVFVVGATGYMGRELIGRLLERGHQVRALARRGSENKVPPGCETITGDALAPTYAPSVPPADTLVHLVGVPRPSPSKAAQFRSVDLPACRASIDAAVQAGVSHFVYVSVAHPAPMMHAFIEVRAACEQYLRDSRLNATILRPWYVLGPGHRWPYTLLPFYWLGEKIPSTREGARRLGLVTLAQMTNALVEAVENPASGVRIVDVPAIRSARPLQDRALPAHGG